MAVAETTDTTTTTTAEPAEPFRQRNFRAPDVLWEAFREECTREGATPAEILRELMRDYVRAGQDRRARA